MGRQRKWGKNGYIHDFHRTADGGYKYEGKFMYADKMLLKRLYLKLAIIQTVMIIAAIIPGFATTAGLQNSFYVIIPYVLWVISALIMTYKTVCIFLGSSPMRSYVYERSVAAYTPCAYISLTGAVLTLLGLIVFIVRGGTGDGAAICILCCIVQIVSSVTAVKSKVADCFTELEN